jgi:hypothetical protein
MTLTEMDHPHPQNSSPQHGIMSIPEREMPVWQDPELAADIREAIADAEAGRTADLGDFRTYLDEAASSPDGEPAVISRPRPQVVAAGRSSTTGSRPAPPLP